MIMHNKFLHARVLLTITAMLLFTSTVWSRDQIRIVGSTSVYTFATAVAEHFGKTSDFKTPIVEATGTGGGIKLFCGGVGPHYPDIANASRAITESERDHCATNGVDDIIEIVIGYDGIVIGINRNANHISLTKAQLYQALAEKIEHDGSWIANPNIYWTDIAPTLPNKKILVLGPTTTLATRNVFEILVIKAGCQQIVADPQQCSTTLREDGAFLEVAEHDNVVVQKLAINPNAIGVFSFGFLEQNRHKVKAIPIDGVLPTYKTISTKQYPISRPLYFYVKKSHINLIPGIREYIEAFLSDQATGYYGYLSKKGLIPMTEKARLHQTEQVQALLETVG